MTQAMLMRTKTTGPKAKAIGPRVAAMTQLAGRQPHSVRATISSVLRKKLGLNVTCAAPGASGERLYRIVTGA